MNKIIKRNLRSLLLGNLLLVMPLAGNAIAADVFNGARIYEQHCSFCHGIDGSGNFRPEMPNFVEGDTLMQPDSVLLESTRLGKGTMPGFRGILTDEEILDSIAHIRTLQFNQFNQPLR